VNIFYLHIIPPGTDVAKGEAATLPSKVEDWSANDVRTWLTANMQEIGVGVADVNRYVTMVFIKIEHSYHRIFYEICRTILAKSMLLVSR